MNRTLKGSRKHLIKGQLNEINEDKNISFMEKETNDEVLIKFHLSDAEYAIYAEEYLPLELSNKGHKKADITVLLLDEEKKRIKYYIADVKSNITGPERICSLCEQWNAGLNYVRYHILSAFESDFTEEEHIAVYTREFDESRIQRMIVDLENKISHMNANADKGIQAAIKLRMLEGVKLQEELPIVKDFLEKRFTYSDRFVKEEKHAFEVGQLLHDDVSQNYQYTLDVSF